MIQLSGVEIFFVCTTILSLIINIVQFIKIHPIYNGLCGLMNDCRIKAKYYADNQKNEAIGKKVIADLDGFGQQIYGLLKTIREKDRTFCAYSFTQDTKINQ